MPIVFASPCATGKTSHKEALKKHFRADVVYDDGDNRFGYFRPGRNALVLCESASEFPTARVLTREEMNEAMVAAGGYAIWNEDGSVNH